MSLDARLREILADFEVNGSFKENSEPEYIAQIKAAFSTDDEYMTGQEWYDRFMEEMDKDGEWVIVGHGVVDEAAKKASGL